MFKSLILDKGFNKTPTLNGDISILLDTQEFWGTLNLIFKMLLFLPG